MPWDWLYRVGVVLAPLAIGGAAVYAGLMWTLCEPLKSSAALDAPGGLYYGWYGPETLLAGNSLLLGWIAVAVSQSRLGISGMIVLLIAAPCWAFAIGVGFLIGATLTVGFPHFAEWLAASAALTVGAGAVRTWLPD